MKARDALLNRLPDQGNHLLLVTRRAVSEAYAHAAQRDAYHAKTFIADLAARLQKRVQVSSDSLAAYADAMERGFGTEVDYGQISKTFAFTNLNQHAAGRYSPAEVVKLKKRLCLGCRTLTAFPRLMLKSRITRCVCTAAA
jgi:hypothetical protein